MGLFFFFFLTLIEDKLGLGFREKKCFGGNEKEIVKSKRAVDPPLGRFGCLLWEILVGYSFSNSSVALSSDKFDYYVLLVLFGDW